MVELVGLLVCRDVFESDLVAALVPAHIDLPRAERGRATIGIERRYTVTGLEQH